MSELLPPVTARAWVEVNLDALVRNAQRYAARVGTPMLPMVKANGYGLGAVAVARALEPLAPWGYGVATVPEGHELRAAGIERPILLCSPLVPSMVEYVRAARLRPTIGDLDALRAWIAACEDPFHLEVDTGMSRAGIPWDDHAALHRASEILAFADGFEGVLTHFHSAEADPTATRVQWERLHLAMEVLGRRPPLVHAANSAGGGYGAAYRGDLARPGIHLYGGSVPGLESEPVVAVRARVVALRDVPAGATVSYGADWTAQHRSTIATLAIGYGDGIPRALAARGLVAIGGTTVRIAGRITMDHLMVDVTGLSVRIGDVATILGPDVSLDDQAARAGTIGYELLTALGPRLPRRYGGFA